MRTMTNASYLWTSVFFVDMSSQITIDVNDIPIYNLIIQILNSFTDRQFHGLNSRKFIFLQAII